MTNPHEATIGNHLRYLDASKVDSPAGALSGIDVRTEDGKNIGGFDGVLIDPAARCIRYYVVTLRRWFGGRRFLLPADSPAQLETTRKALRFTIDLPTLESCREFRRGEVGNFSDVDLLSAMFARTAG